MEDYLLNRLMFVALNSIAEIGTSKVSMWSSSDKYAYPPFLRFKWKEAGKDTSSLYNQLNSSIEDFNGNFKWGLKRKMGSSNCIIAANSYMDSLLTYGFDLRESLLLQMPFSRYKEMIDLAINDIPILVRCICVDFGVPFPTIDQLR